MKSKSVANYIEKKRRIYMYSVNVKNSVHKESEENWVELLKKFWASDVEKLFNKEGYDEGAAGSLLSIYYELIADERLHSCKELGLYVIPKLLEAISYTIPRNFKWERK
jgi:hypothetical protein